MIDIKEGIIIREDSNLDEIVGNDEFFIQLKENPTEERTKQLKQQILQDHEDANNLKGMMEMFGAKDWDEWGKLFTVFSNQANKDRQIVKRLKKLLKTYKNEEWEDESLRKMVNRELKEILEEKK